MGSQRVGHNWATSLHFTSLLGRKVMTNIDSIFKSRDITLPTNVHLVKAMVYPVVMYGWEMLDCEESWALKNWCFWTLVLEKTLESLLDCKEIKPVNPEGNQPWIFFGRTAAEAEAPILWPPDTKSRLIRRDCDVGAIEGRRRDNRGQDNWMASLTWVWASSRKWCRTGKPGVLQSMGSQTVGHYWATEQLTIYIHIHI